MSPLLLLLTLRLISIQSSVSAEFSGGDENSDEDCGDEEGNTAVQNFRLRTELGIGGINKFYLIF